VREGQEVHVVDNATGADLTAETLTKILMEEGSSGTRRLPTAFLHDVVRWGDRMRATTVDQIEHRIDQLVEASLSRIGPVHQMREEMEALRNRIAELEAAVASRFGNPASRAEQLLQEAHRETHTDDSKPAHSGGES
jgi:polyhydroxyalkanoate synthesis regulator protein